MILDRAEVVAPTARIAAAAAWRSAFSSDMTLEMKTPPVGLSTVPVLCWKTQIKGRT